MSASNSSRYHPMTNRSSVMPHHPLNHCPYFTAPLSLSTTIIMTPTSSSLSNSIPPGPRSPLRSYLPSLVALLLVSYLLNYALPSTYLHPSFILPNHDAAIPPNESAPSLQKGISSKTALILTAHPDDECMFFGPIILGLIEEGWKVKGLCLSEGR